MTTKSPPTRSKPSKKKPASRKGAAKASTGKTAKKTKKSPAKSAAPQTKTKAQRAATGVASAPPALSVEDRRGMIAQAAYLYAEQRGFTGGDPVQDWLRAEAEVDAALASGQSATTTGDVS
jgi:hypothetical protein